MPQVLNEVVSLSSRTLGSGAARLEVSEMGFGVMGMTYHRGVVGDTAQMIRLLHEARSFGCTYFYTAEIYGPYTNEALLGEAFGSRSDVLIATKFGHKIVNGQACYGGLDSTPAAIRRSCEGSLRRLKRETIDLYYQHRADPNVPAEEVAGTVKALIAEGKVRAFGLSEVSADYIRRAHAVLPITAVQNEYHLMWRRPEQTIFPTLKELGIGFVAYSPLNRGYLSGSMNADTRFSKQNDNRSTLPRFTPQALALNYPIIQLLKRFADAHGITVAQTHLAWILHKAPNIVPIPGTTKENHMTEDFRAAKVRIDPADWDTLEREAGEIQIYGDRYSGVEKAQAG